MKQTQMYVCTLKNIYSSRYLDTLESSMELNNIGKILVYIHSQWRIQDFPQGGVPTPNIAIIFRIFAENCMKMKEFGPQGGCASLVPPLRSPSDLQQRIEKCENSS